MNSSTICSRRGLNAVSLLAPSPPAVSAASGGMGASSRLSSVGPTAIRSARGGNAPVQGGALAQGPAKRLDQGAELILAHVLAVARTRRTRDVFIHQGAAQVVGSRRQNLRCAGRPHLDPADLDVRDPAVIGDAAHRVHEDRLAKRRAATRLALD